MKQEKNEIFIKDRADPFITRGSDGYYYFTASYPMYGKDDPEGYDRIILRRSKTVEGLKTAEEKTIWDEKDCKTAHRFIWAPEIHEIGGRWYAFFAASGSSDNVWDINCHAIVCKGEDPYNDSWEGLEKMKCPDDDDFSFTRFSLDMTHFSHFGRHYLLWAQHGGNSNVYIAEVKPNEPNRTICKAILFTKPEFDWERVNIPVNEGPAVLKHGGRIFVAFSASATGPEYCVGLMYADENADLLNMDNWTKLDRPLLCSDDLVGEYGPGHNSFVQDENGDWLIVYHSRDERCCRKECEHADGDPLYDPCRSTHIRKIEWDENGLPIFNA